MRELTWPPAASSISGSASSMTAAASSVSGSQYGRGTSSVKAHSPRPARSLMRSSSSGVAAVLWATTSTRVALMAWSLRRVGELRGREAEQESEQHRAGMHVRLERLEAAREHGPQVGVDAHGLLQPVHGVGRDAVRPDGHEVLEAVEGLGQLVLHRAMVARGPDGLTDPLQNRLQKSMK